MLDHILPNNTSMLFNHKLALPRYLPTSWLHAAPLASFRSSFHTSATAAGANVSPPSTQGPLRYAVIGGGFAGVAVAWHLLQRSSAASPIRLDLYDAFGLGSGGSGAAAGLLHPYTPRGKVLWQGLEAFNDALQLVEAAESAAEPRKTEKFVWRHGLLRPARSLKQARDFAKHVSKDVAAAQACGAECAGKYEELRRIVPGLEAQSLVGTPDTSIDDTTLLEEIENTDAVGLFTRSAIVIQPRGYLEALWRSCELTAARSSPLSSAHLQTRSITSLAQLHQEEGPFDGIIVAAGAAVDSIRETVGMLPLDLCHGYSIDMESVESAPGYPSDAPGLLGSPYIAPHGTRRAVVGATQRHDCAPEEAVAALGPGSLMERDGEEWESAVHALIPKAGHLWPAMGNDELWRVAAVRSGFRAIPQRTAQGAIPYAGRVQDTNNKPRSGINQESNVNINCPWWVVGGLGARGLVYHAWLGRLVAAAVVANSEAELPPELLRWKK